MTRNTKYKFIGLFTLLSAMAGVSSCSDNSVTEPEIIRPGDTSQDSSAAQDIPVNLAFLMEQDNVTRADSDYDGAVTGVISKGELVDFLVFAIYDADGNLMDEFVNENNTKLTTGVGVSVTAGKGQNIIKWNGNGKTAFSLVMTKGETYTIVAWAQSSLCKAYNFQNLENVTVDYTGALNNDESRDAFSASVTFTVPDKNEHSLDVTLIRPFAQVNVGTTGADYKNTALTPGGTYYTYSSIELKGVANSFNVLKNEPGKTTQTATFNYAELPAYYGMQNIPATEEELVKSKDELFLMIHLNDKDDTSTTAFAEYLISYPTVTMGKDGNIEKYLTETFKYLSMCYVLVPGKTTLDNVKVSFSSDNQGVGYETYFEVGNVPVDMNWRTNILGGLYAPTQTPNTPTDPDDPNNPGPDQPGPDNPGPDNPGPDDPTPPGPTPPDEPVDDPTSVFNGISCSVMIVSDYNNGDNNYQRDKNNQNGYTDIKK